MTIQIPNVGTGVPADQTGDSPWLAMQKVADNFSNSSHAASKLIGVSNSEISLNVDLLKVLANASPAQTPEDLNAFRPTLGITSFIINNSVANKPVNDSQSILGLGDNNTALQLMVRARAPGEIRVRTYAGVSGGWSTWGVVYTSANTTVDSNGFIKQSSPIVKVHADKIELNDDAKQQDVTFTKNGIGDYTINTVSGLSTDGWYLELPLDLNGNPKVAVTLTEADGIIELKCYKRIFSMETFTFGPDLSEPLDIPDGRWIDIRLNEIEHEAPTLPDVDLDKKD